jgi:hypothetical protein
MYAVDWMQRGEGKRSLGDVYEWAKQNQSDLFKTIFGEIKSPSFHKSKTVLEMYRDCNRSHTCKKNHKMYINMARIGNMDDYVGIDWLIWWYQRNLIIFSNLARLATSIDDRILLIIGSAHIHLLKQFLEESGNFEMVAIENYL